MTGDRGGNGAGGPAGTVAPTVRAFPEGTPSMADLLVARADDDHPGLRAGDDTWSWREVVAEAAARAAWLADGPELDPPHLGVLLGNVPDFLHWLGAAALAGATVVGINSTRRGAALAGDIRRTDCRLLVTDHAGLALLDGLDTGVPADRVVVVDDPGTADALAPYRDADPRDVVGRCRPGVDDLYLLLFTSGTTGDPKAVRCTQGRLAAIGANAAGGYGYERDDVAYCSMPLFHGNALMALWAPALTVGATVALAPRFSASGFVDDVHRYGVTMFTYVGKALAYVLATPPRPDDATCPLRRGFGTEASLADLAAFRQRFGCVLLEGYGSSEGGANIVRTPDTPVGALGPAQGDLVVLDPDTLAECPPARFDAAGRLTNPGEAIGEIVNRDGAPRFEGYYGNAEANAEKLRHGWYWTGDLAYRDEAGFFYFAGRGGDWLRVDSENLTAGPIERVLVRHPDVAAAAVYGIPDPRSGDQVMAALELLPGRTIDPVGFGSFLVAQDDLGTKWPPAFVRLTDGLPQTASGKATKEPLRRQGWWASDDPVLRRVGPGLVYAPLDGIGRAELRAEFARHGRDELLGR